jgi:16S rRNA processing protein RimM
VDSGLLIAGEIGKPHGLAGEVYVVRISDDPRRFEPGSQLLHEDGRELRVAGARPHGNRFLVRFAGYEDRSAAESLRGAVFVRGEDVRALDDDEYWPHELTGCNVFLVDGVRVGEVGGVIAGAGQDLLQVETNAGERLVPLVKEIVVDVDVPLRRIVIAPPEGLLD